MMKFDGPRATRLLAYWIICLGTIGMHYAYSIVYVQLLDALNESREATAFVGSLASGMMDGMGIFSGRLVEVYGNRRCALVGAAMVTIGWFLSSLATNTWQLFFTFSILVGYGHSLSLFGAIALMSKWFSTRLALAHACGNSGGAASPFLMGLFVPQLFDATGWRSAFLIIGGINGSLLIFAGLLLTPPPAEHGAVVTVSGTAAADDKPDAAEPPPAALAPAAAALEPAAAAKATASASSRAASPEAGAMKPAATEAGAADSAVPVTMANLVRSRRFQLLSLAMFSFGLGGFGSVVHLVRLAMDSGMDEGRAARLLLFLSLGSVVLRLPGALLADKLGRLKLATIALTLHSMMHLASSLHAARASSAFLSFWACTIGGLNGTVLSTSAAIPLELLPAHFTSLAASAVYSPMGVGFMLAPVLTAALQRATGDYSAAMAVAAGLLAVAAGLMGLLATLPRPQPPKPVRAANASESEVSQPDGAVDASRL